MNIGMFFTAIENEHYLHSHETNSHYGNYYNWIDIVSQLPSRFYKGPYGILIENYSTLRPLSMDINDKLYNYLKDTLNGL